MASYKPEQDAEIFVGLNGLRSAYTKLLSEFKSGEWLFFYIHKKEYEKESDIFYNSISKFSKALKKHNRGICNKEYLHSKFSKKAKFLNIRYVDFPIPVNVDVCNDKVLIVSWSPQPIAFLIKSKEIANSIGEYFEQVWRISK